jgi:hypothetical protein
MTEGKKQSKKQSLKKATGTTSLSPVMLKKVSEIANTKLTKGELTAKLEALIGKADKKLLSQLYTVAILLNTKKTIKPFDVEQNNDTNHYHIDRRTGETCNSDYWTSSISGTESFSWSGSNMVNNLKNIKN